MKTPLVIFSAICGITFGALAAQKPFPRGTMVVLPVDDTNLSGEACWSNPNIIGVCLRTAWTATEHYQGKFNWKQFDSGIALAQANNKFVVLSVTAIFPPPWVTAVVKVWKNSFDESCPYPWDPNLQSFWSALVQAMGTRYDGVSCVHGVDMWAGGTGGPDDGTGIDCFFAPTSADCTALDAIAGGGPNSGNVLWSNACEALGAMYVNAFPTTACFLHPGRNYGNLDPQSMDTITSWWLSLRSNANSLFNNEFDAGLPQSDPKLGYIPWPHTSLKISSINNGMFQTRGAIGSTRMKGQTLAQVFKNVQNVVAVQIYPSDPGTDPGQTTIINFNKSVGL
jgi:hypothetical protein